jgi:hypothetical protein
MVRLVTDVERPHVSVLRVLEEERLAPTAREHEHQRGALTDEDLVVRIPTLGSVIRPVTALLSSNSLIENKLTQVDVYGPPVPELWHISRTGRDFLNYLDEPPTPDEPLA